MADVLDPERIRFVGATLLLGVPDLPLLGKWRLVMMVDCIPCYGNAIHHKDDDRDPGDDLLSMGERF
jgi:hypothetical protein